MGRAWTRQALKRLQELHTQLRQTSEALVEHVDKTSFATPQDLTKVGALQMGRGAHACFTHPERLPRHTRVGRPRVAGAA